MKHRLIYEDKEGRCKIVVADEKFQQKYESDADSIGRLYALSIAGVTEFLVCLEEDMPKDITFREAWKKGTVEQPIIVDFDKAIQIHRQRLKEVCAKKIDLLNQELEIAEEEQDIVKQVAINRTKKIFRTLHEMNLTHCKTTEDIKYSIPKELHEVWTFYDPVSGGN